MPGPGEGCGQAATDAAVSEYGDHGHADLVLPVLVVLKGGQRESVATASACTPGAAASKLSLSGVQGRPSASEIRPPASATSSAPGSRSARAPANCQKASIRPAATFSRCRVAGTEVRTTSASKSIAVIE